MSNDESRKNNLKRAVFFIAGILVISVLVLLIYRAQERANEAEIPKEDLVSLPLSELEIKYSGDDMLSFSASLSRDLLAEYLERKGMKAGSFLKLLPETVSVSCSCKAAVSPSEKYIVVKLLSASVNGVALPRKFLTDMGEIKLDFERSLVYN